MPDGSAPKYAPSLCIVPPSLEWIALEVERRVTFQLYARVREGQSSLEDACELLLPSVGECATKAWKTGTFDRNATVLLAYFDAALLALCHVHGAEDLGLELRELRDMILGWRA